MPDPIRGQAYDFTIALVDSGARPAYKSAPTLAAGDFKLSKDEGPLVNLATLPTVTPVGSVLVHIALSAAEMTADNVTIVCRDVVGAQWDDQLIEISTEAVATTIVPVPADGVSTWSARDLITIALRKIGVLAAGELPDPAMAQDALGELNRLLEQWGLSSLMTVSRVTVIKALTSGQAAVTIGAGGDINVTRPIRIGSAYTSNGSQDTRLTQISRQEYDSLAYKTTYTSQFPCLLQYEAAFPVGTLRLWPVPSGGLTLTLAVEAQFSAFATILQTAALPPGYADAAIYGLARRLAPEYGRALDPNFLDEYRQVMKQVKRQNSQPRVLGIDSALAGIGRQADDQWITHGGYL